MPINMLAKFYTCHVESRLCHRNVISTVKACKKHPRSKID